MGVFHLQNRLVHLPECEQPVIDQGYYIDGQNTQLIFFENIFTEGGEKASQITARGLNFLDHYLL